MLISTILLIANLVDKIIYNKVLFSFWNFLWIYPAEIALYLIIFVLIAWITTK